MRQTLDKMLDKDISNFIIYDGVNTRYLKPGLSNRT